MSPGLYNLWWRLATQDRSASWSDALLSAVLRAASVGYQAVVAGRNAAYDGGLIKPTRLSCPVISIGNVTVGGSGKTACVELVTKHLTAMGRRVAILSRGYGGPPGPYALRWASGRLVVDSPDRRQRSVDELADEPRMLAARLDGVPVVVGARRSETGRWAIKMWQPHVIVLDDGFQHRPLHRDCDIVLLPARMPPAGWALLPRGPMREPLSSLTRAQIMILTKADQVEGTALEALRECIRAVNPQAALLTAVHEPTDVLDGGSGALEPLARLEGKQVGLVSSVGDPESVEQTVRQCGAQIAWHRSFPDHHAYTADDVAAVWDQVEAQRPDALLTTEKDWVRLRQCLVASGQWPVPCWIIRVRMRILSGADALHDRLARVCSG